MSVKRSRTGCEERPVCAQCEKANRGCIPSSGVTFRHQQNPSLNGDDADGSLKNFYGYRETFEKETTWVDVPKDLTFVHISNPYDDEDIEHFGEVEDARFVTFAGQYGAQPEQPNAGQDEHDMARQLSMSGSQGLEALSTMANRDSYALPPAPISLLDREHRQPVSPASPPHAAPIAHQTLEFILNPASSAPPGNIDPQLHVEAAESSPVASNTDRGQGYLPRPNLERQERASIDNPELAFLLRDFSERTGFWMDLYDVNLFFAGTVPVLAIHCPLLLYSCAALSAKSLAGIAGRKPTLGGQVAPGMKSRMETWSGPPMTVDDWHHKAREFYDLAVSLLRQALADAARPLDASNSAHPSPSILLATQNYRLPTTDSDELVAATAILCVYEMIDASTPEWSRHLDGTKSLFDIANDRMTDITQPPSPHLPRTPASQLSSTLDSHPRALSPGRSAVFWCFARQDMISAFINSTRTRLDTSDLDLWRSAGLKITREGLVCPSNHKHRDYHPRSAMLDDMVSNALVWLLAKLVSLIAAGEEHAGSSPPGTGKRQREQLDDWERLEAQLTYWYDGAPAGFYPTAVLPRDPVNLPGLMEQWFPRPMCASTAQWWHFARIQLLHHKPHLHSPAPSAGTSLAARHASYASILHQSREHAKAIIAIGFGRSDEAARVNNVQPLWTAGLVLGSAEGDHVSDETWMWRRSVLSLLRGIEHDLGWSADYRVQSLLELWKLPPDWE